MDKELRPKIGKYEVGMYLLILFFAVSCFAALSR